MSDKLKVGVAGLGRMGAIHALHLHELSQERSDCEFAALANPDVERAKQFTAELGIAVPIFPSVSALLESKVCDVFVVVTPTENHREHTVALIAAGHRVLLEKPLTGTLDGDREFAGYLDRHAPRSVMLAFQRRFDAPLAYAKELMDSGAIGRVFKVVSSLEDSGPAPNGYKSPGILPDMSIHNVDEILWLSGLRPTEALAIGSRLYSHSRTTCQEDFDDALLYVWFGGGMIGQVQVSRNHVSGYRVETVIYGEGGQIQVGRFDQNPFEITVQAYGRRHSAAPIAQRTFTMRDYGRPLAEFVDRFGPAYKTELAVFLDCCRSNADFPTSHTDGIRAQEVISAAMSSVITRDSAVTAKLD